MSTKKKKAPATGVRYTDAQKKEIVNFVSQYNKTNGRGGQSAAANKYKVTPLTISGWLKAAGVKAPAGNKIKKAAKKAAKVAGKTAKSGKGGKGGKGIRYPDEVKQQVVDFVTSYNDVNGRGGQNQAAKKFKLSVLTVAAWLKAAGVKKPTSKKTTAKVAAKKVSKKAAKKVTKKTAKASGDLAAFKAELLKLIKSF